MAGGKLVFAEAPDVDVVNLPLFIDSLSVTGTKIVRLWKCVATKWPFQWNYTG